MKIAVNVILVALIAYLAYLLYANIREPIAFNAEKQKRTLAVVEKLIKIRTTQDLYRDITGEFAADFDTLQHVMENDSFMIVNVMGDPDDPNFDPADITYDTSFLPAIDSINALGFNLDSLRFVPYGEGAEFEIDADTLTYQKTKVNVVQVGVRRKVFMGPYADERFAKYDNRYDPEAMLKFGDMSSPNTSGNWER